MELPQYASEIAEFLGLPVCGRDLEIVRPRALGEVEEGALLFAVHPDAETIRMLNAHTNICVLVSETYANELTVTYIPAANPRLAFAKVLQHFFAVPKRSTIASTAVISPSAKLGTGVVVGEFSVIDDGVEIGKNTEVRDHVVLRNCSIGQNCLIKSGTVIGEEGFGFDFEPDGTPVRIPHLGRVVIGDHVEVGALCIIARGTLGDTVICSHVKMDDIVQVAHNVEIGENAILTGGVTVGGSARVGRNVWLGPQAAVMNKITIHDGAMAGLGAAVMKSVSPNVVVAGNPARLLHDRDEE